MKLTDAIITDAAKAAFKAYNHAPKVIWDRRLILKIK